MSFAYDPDAKAGIIAARDYAEERIVQWKKDEDDLRDLANRIGSETITKATEKTVENIEATIKLFREMIEGDEGEQGKVSDGVATLYSAIHMCEQMEGF